MKLLDSKTTVARYTPPRIEKVLCVCCRKKLAKHKAYGIEIQRQLSAQSAGMATWVYNSAANLIFRDDGWHESFQYYYTGQPQKNLMTYLLFTYTGFACCQAHAEEALALQPWDYVLPPAKNTLGKIL